MSIEVVEEHWFKLRCRGTHTHGEGELARTYQCDDHIDHIGSHHHALDDKVMFWASEDDIINARQQAELDAMTDEEVMLTLTGGDKEKEEEVKRWAETSAHFVQSGLKMHREIAELREKLAATQAELKRIQEEKHDGG